MIKGVGVKKRRLKIIAKKLIDECGIKWYVLENEYGEKMLGGYRFPSRLSAYRRFVACYPAYVGETRALRHGGYSIDITAEWSESEKSDLSKNAGK